MKKKDVLMDWKGSFIIPYWNLDILVEGERVSANDKKVLVGNFSLFVIASPTGRGNPVRGVVGVARASAGLPRRAVALLAMTRWGVGVVVSAGLPRRLRSSQ